MCDCDCRCWHSKPVRQRLTNTFIHTDIFGARDGSLNVKCVEQPGLQHGGCRCNRVWQEPTVRDIRHRPRDHPDNHFYNQELAGRGCCHLLHQQRQEPPNQQEHGQGEHQEQDIRVQSQTQPVKVVQSHYYRQHNDPPAGRYDHPAGGGCRTSYYPKSRGIHTGEAIMYDRHECHKDQWFNDAKEREIDRLNSNPNKGYSSYRKQLELASNTFDFIDDDVGLPCKPTAKFGTTRFQNDCCVQEQAPKIAVGKACCKEPQQPAIEVQHEQEAKEVPRKPVEQPPPAATVSFKADQPKVEQQKTVKQSTKSTIKPASTKPIPAKTTFKPSTASGPRTVAHQKGDLENKSSLVPAGKCGCSCKCWQVLGRT